MESDTCGISLVGLFLSVWISKGATISGLNALDRGMTCAYINLDMPINVR